MKQDSTDRYSWSLSRRGCGVIRCRWEGFAGTSLNLYLAASSSWSFVSSSKLLFLFLFYFVLSSSSVSLCLHITFHHYFSIFFSYLVSGFFDWCGFSFLLSNHKLPISFCSSYISTYCTILFSFPLKFFHVLINLCPSFPYFNLSPSVVLPY